MHPRQWPVARKLLALSLTGLLVALVIGAVSWTSARQLRASGLKVATLTRADQDLRDLDMFVSDVQVAVRDALLAASDADRTAADDALAGTTGEIDGALRDLAATPLPTDLETTTAVTAMTTARARGKVLEQTAVVTSTAVGKRLEAAQHAQAATQSRMQWTIAVALGLGVLVLAGISRWITVLITRPLTQLAAAADKLADGVTEFDVDTTGVDEGGRALAALARTRANVAALVADAGGLVEAAAQGRLSARADADRHAGGYRSVVEGINRTLDNVTGPSRTSPACSGRSRRATSPRPWRRRTRATSSSCGAPSTPPSPGSPRPWPRSSWEPTSS